MALELILIFICLISKICQHHQTLVRGIWVLKRCILAIKGTELLEQLLSFPHGVPLFIYVDHVLGIRQVEVPYCDLVVEELKFLFKLKELSTVVELDDLSNFILSYTVLFLIFYDMEEGLLILRNNDFFHLEF